LLRLVVEERLPERPAMLEPQTYALLMLGAFFALLMAGIPVAVTLATVGFVFGWLGFGDALFNLLPARVFGVVAGYQWMSIPLFVFMGVMLEKSRLADDLLDVMGHIAGGVRGGMGVGIILFGVLMGATTGIVGATVITLGLLTLPTLIRRGYDKRIACGAICASGTLGQIIPPSLILILLSDIMQLSVGTLFAAAVGPGLLLAGGVHHCSCCCWAGGSPPDAAAAAGRTRRRGPARAVAALLEGGGAADPAGGVGAGLDRRRRCGADRGGVDGGGGLHPHHRGAGRFRWPVLKAVALETAKITAIMMFILMMAQVFALAFRGLHGEDLIVRLFEWLPGGVNSDIWFMMALIFVLGFFIEWIEISYIAVPLFLPVLLNQGVDPVWLAMLITVNLQSSFLTPPFGWALFYLKGVAPPEVGIRTSTRACCLSCCCRA
jgi:TRAP-type mannitol/chloroaromatic compound transport system permease large subunit